VADALEHERAALDPIFQMNIDLDLLKTLGLAGRVAEWRRLCNEQLNKKEEA
jgi:hypothetical protein